MSPHVRPDILIKLGGSIITDKTQQNVFRTSVMSRLAGELYAGMQATGMQLSAMEFTISASLRAKTEEELTGEALAAFQSRADMIRKSLKAKTLKIVTIHLDTQTPRPSRPMFRAKAMASRAEATPPAAEAGTSSILVNAAGTVQVK